MRLQKFIDFLDFLNAHQWHGTTANLIEKEAILYLKEIGALLFCNKAYFNDDFHQVDYSEYGTTWPCSNCGKRCAERRWRLTVKKFIFFNTTYKLERCSCGRWRPTRNVNVPA